MLMADPRKCIFEISSTEPAFARAGSVVPPIIYLTTAGFLLSLAR